MPPRPLRPIALALLTAAAAVSAADKAPPVAWSQATPPFRIVGNTWFVGTEGITVLLLRGTEGAVLIDTGVPQSLESLQANIASLGVAPNEIEWILTSHAHADHAGALAAMKAWTGARVLATSESAALLAAGGHGDLHFGDELTYPPVEVDATLSDGETVKLGSLELILHHTPGHTPGSSTWSWRETHQGQSVTVVYADSLTAPGYRLFDHPQLPHLVEDFKSSFERLRRLRCDLLITPHPEASDLFDRVRDRPPGAGPQFDRAGCAKYAGRAERALEKQAEAQRSAPTRPASGAGAPALRPRGRAAPDAA